MVQLRNGPGFAVEPCLELGVAGGGCRENLDGHRAFEPGIAGAVNLAHSAGSQRTKNFVGAEARSWSQRHGGIMHLNALHNSCL
jgi:hypothetical protein